METRHKTEDLVKGKVYYFDNNKSGYGIFSHIEGDGAHFVPLQIGKYISFKGIVAIPIFKHCDWILKENSIKISDGIKMIGLILKEPPKGICISGFDNKIKLVEDNYTHLKFKQPSNLSELKIGMMVQIVDNNGDFPLSWKWFELTEKLLLILNNKEDSLKWVRLPNY